MRPLNRIPIDEVRAKTYKIRDSWWTVLLVDPLAARLVRLVAPYRSVTPNRTSFAALLVGLGAAACFGTAERPWLALGALLFHLAFVLDCMDGKIARLNGTGTVFGAWLDYMLDRIRVVVCAVALFGAQYAQTRDIWYLVVGGAIVFLDTVHHVNSLEIARVKATMAEQLAAAGQRLAAARAHPAPTAPAPATPAPTAPAAVGPGPAAVRPAPAANGPGPAASGPGPAVSITEGDPRPDFRSQFTLYVRLRNALIASRIRLNLISTVELHMAVFILAPLTGAVLSVSIAVGALLVLFEMAVSYSLYLNTRAFTRKLAVATAAAEAAERAARVDQRPATADSLS
ncbi:MAG TPA: CDP-alcohol phosphatidyltransferase family protein [Catenuloplanes sp.]